MKKNILKKKKKIKKLKKGEIIFTNCYIKKIEEWQFYFKRKIGKIVLIWSKDKEEISELIDGDELDHDISGWNRGKWKYNFLKNGYYKCDVMLHFFESFNGETTEYDMNVYFERIYPVKPSKVKNKIKFGIKNKYIPEFITQYDWNIKQ